LKAQKLYHNSFIFAIIKTKIKMEKLFYKVMFELKGISTQRFACVKITGKKEQRMTGTPDFVFSVISAASGNPMLLSVIFAKLCFAEIPMLYL
jgi:hypothetical protein